jgi:DNA-binding XRE family transcriptional regulator
MEGSAMNKFKADRLKLGITQAELAPILGVSIRTIQQYEQGIYKPSKAVLMLLELELKK